MEAITTKVSKVSIGMFIINLWYLHVPPTPPPQPAELLPLSLDGRTWETVASEERWDVIIAFPSSVMHKLHFARVATELYSSHNDIIISPVIKYQRHVIEFHPQWLQLHYWGPAVVAAGEGVIGRRRRRNEDKKQKSNINWCNYFVQLLILFQKFTASSPHRIPRR